ncbi:MAG: hypothetical protein K2X82_17550 [Gemmataceae bacterium]|nr:hypothetical protein [Gemmataceae bacterium]
MTPYDFVQLALHAAGGKIQGRTKLQKTVYFLGLVTGHLDDLGYQAHHYGPYSADVADAVSTLEAIGFASSAVASVGSVDPQGFEIRRTDYALTEEGVRAAERKARSHPDLYGKLQAGVDQLRRAGDLDYVRLSIAAKAYFLLRQRKAPVAEQELPHLARSFGWAVSEQQIRDGLDYLRQLNLAERVVPA